MRFHRPAAAASIRLLKKATNFTKTNTFCSSPPGGGPMACLLKTRTVVRLRGPDTIKFLQSLLTNDVVGRFVIEKSITPSPLYAAMLSPQGGRFLCDMFLYQPPPRTHDQTDHTLFADVDSHVLDQLFATFNKFSVRSKVHYEHVGQEFSCWQRFGGVDRSSSQGNNVGWQWHKDPRLDCLGFRGIFPSNSTPPMVDADTETEEGNYLLWRLERGVAEGSIEIPRGEAIPLEYNLAGLNAISFDKGCYIGQELIARSHHRGVIRKRLLPLKFLNESGSEVEQKVAPGSEVISLKSGKKAGIVTTAMGSRGLGLLRLEEAFKGSGSLVIKGQEDVKVEAIRPEWWPTEWYSVHGPQQAAG